MTHDIEIRKIPFAFDQVTSPVWHEQMPEWSHMVNGASLTMPYLEPFLIKNLREAVLLINDAELNEDVKGFVGQEAQHFTNHRRFNEFLKANGYAELAQVETSYAETYDALSKKSLAWRLAYTAGFETMTMGITEWLINDRDELFSGADPVVVSLVLWHMVEETEHKSVAYDVFQAVSGNYWLRILGLIYGSLHVGLLSRRAYIVMLKKDGRWGSIRSRLRLWKLLGNFFVKAGAAMIRSFRPSYHPDDVADPKWIHRWQRAYRDSTVNNTSNGDQIPLLDTHSDNIEPVFA